MKWPGVSIIISTYNRADTLDKCLSCLLKLDYPRYEIIVVDDGSTDNTAEVLKEYRKKYKDKIRVITHEKNMGPAAGRMDGIKASKYNVIALLDDDIFVEKGWLKYLVNLLLKGRNNKVAIVSSLVWCNLQSAACWKDIIIKAGGFDKKFPTAFREDTDLGFRVMDLGYKIIKAPKLNYVHKKPRPKTLKGKLRALWRHFLIFQSDCLLFKKHPKRAKEFLKVKWRIVSPLWDFKFITGLHEGNEIRLGRPGGLFYIKGNVLTIPFILLAGIVYVFILKLVRLYGSIKFGTFLI